MTDFTTVPDCLVFKFEEVEKEGFIKPVNYVEEQDIVDKTIMYILNYTIKLLGQTTMQKPPPDTPRVIVEGGESDGNV